MKEHHMQSDFDFRLMSIEYRLRDWLRPPLDMLQEAGVAPGMTVLDFGCGPGGFTMAAAHLVGPQGLVYAVDIHPLAVKSIEKARQKQRFNNIESVLGDEMVHVPAGNADIALAYDVLHDLSDPGQTLKELHRVLRTEGVLSVTDHHLKEEALLYMVTGGGLFRILGRGRRTFQFEKIDLPKEST